MDVAQLGLAIDSAQARTAARDLDKLAAAADKTEISVVSLTSASRELLRDEKGRFISAADSAAKYAAEIDALRTKYNPLYAASKQFEASQAEIKRALELGAISAAQADAALSSLNSQMIVAAGSNDRFGKSMNASAAHTNNLLFQFQDIAMMMASGQNPLVLAMQQGSQVSGIFQQMKDSGQSAGSAIKGALIGLVSPMSMLTLGVIAGGAALFQWGMSALGASSNAKTFDDMLSSIESGISEVSQISKDYAADGIEGLISQYGILNQELLTHLERVRLVRTEQELAKNADIADTLKNSMTGGWLTSDIDDIRILFETTNDSARGLLSILEQIKAAKTFEEQEAALRRARNYVDNLVDGMGEVSKEASKVQGEIVLAEDAAKKLAEANRNAEKAAKGLANTDITSGISSAASAAAMLSVNLGISLETASKLAALGPQGIGGYTGPKSSGRGSMNPSTGDSIIAGMGGITPESTARLEAIEKAYRERNKKASKGGGASAAENAFEQLKIRLEKDSLFQFEKYQRDQKILEEALAKKATTQKEYDELQALLKTEYWGSEYEKELAQRAMEQTALEEALEKKYITQEQYQQRLAELRSQEMTATLGHYDTLFGNMVSIAQAGGNKATGIVKAFSVAQGLINSYLAYTQVLADPSLVGRPFLRTALAASTLAAGLAQVANMKSGGGGGGSGGASATSSATAPQEPERITRIELVGEDWQVAMAESLLTQAYEATKNGRVIIGRA